MKLSRVSFILACTSFLAFAAYAQTDPTAPPAPTDTLVEAPAAPETPDAAEIEAAARDYIRAFNLQAGEARRRVRLMRLAARLEQRLARDEAANFASLRIEHAPRFRIIASFKQDAAAAIARHAAGLDFAGSLENETVPRSLRELGELREPLQAALDRAGIQYLSTADPARGGIDLYVDNRAALEAAVARGAVTLPQATNVVEAPGLIQPEATFVAARATQSSAGGICTLGFAVHARSNGVRGITTAGHCAEPRSPESVAMTTMNELWSGVYDLQWMVAASGSHTYSPSIDLRNGTYRSVFYYMPLASMQLNAPLCLVGDTSGYRCGGTIYRKDVVQSGQCCKVWVRGSADLSGTGDSGGPWFAGNTAYGIHSGAPSGYANDALFMPIEYISIFDLALTAATL